jgi:hypothetical protein
MTARPIATALAVVGLTCAGMYALMAGTGSTTIEGRVIDVQGIPVAECVLQAEHKSFSFSGELQDIASLSDRKGAFSISVPLGVNDIMANCQGADTGTKRLLTVRWQTPESVTLTLS